MHCTEAAGRRLCFVRVPLAPRPPFTSTYCIAFMCDCHVILSAYYYYYYYYYYVEPSLLVFICSDWSQCSTLLACVHCCKAISQLNRDGPFSAPSGSLTDSAEIWHLIFTLHYPPDHTCQIWWLRERGSGASVGDPQSGCFFCFWFLERSCITLRSVNFRSMHTKQNVFWWCCDPSPRSDSAQNIMASFGGSLPLTAENLK